MSASTTGGAKQQAMQSFVKGIWVGEEATDPMSFTSLSVKTIDRDLSGAIDGVTMKIRNE